MAIAFVNATSNTFAGVNDFTADMPSGLANGDLLLFFVATDSLHNTTGTPPTDVTKVGEQDSGGSDSSLSVFRKIAASEGAFLTFTDIFDATETGIVVTVAYRGVDQSTPMDTAAVFGTDSGTPWDTQPITPVTNGAMLVAAFGADPGSAGYQTTWDGGITERIDSDTTPTGQNGTSGYVTIAELSVPTAGTPTTMGGDNNPGDQTACVILCLRPAAAATAVFFGPQSEFNQAVMRASTW